MFTPVTTLGEENGELRTNQNNLCHHLLDLYAGSGYPGQPVNRPGAILTDPNTIVVLLILYTDIRRWIFRDIRDQQQQQQQHGV